MIDEVLAYLISSLSYFSALVKESQTFYLTLFDQIYFAKIIPLLQLKCTSNPSLWFHCCIVETCFEIQLSPAK